MKTLEEQISDVEFQIVELQAKKEQLAKARDLPSEDIQKLAIEMHNCTCQHNHTDGCSWLYEMKDKKHDWSQREHKRQSAHARNLIQLAGDLNTAYRMLDAFRKVRNVSLR